MPRWVSRLGRILVRNRRGTIAPGKIFGLVLVAFALAYTLLVRGFLPVDIASPWIASALERQFGPGHRVEIGSTSLEHDAIGAPYLNVSRIRVIGPHGNVIASAPNAEVGLDGTSLLVGNFRVRRIDLIGAETTVHVGTDGRVAIAAGREAAPILPSAAAAAPPPSSPRAVRGAGRGSAPEAQKPPEPFHFPQLVRWLDSFERSGFDGVALSTIGFKRGTLSVVSAESERTWTFRDIDIHLTRPDEGGMLFSVASGSPEKSWRLTFTAGSVQDNARAIDVVAERLDPDDILLAAGLGDLHFFAETALSGILRAQIAQDGRLMGAAVRATMGSGLMGSTLDPDTHFQLHEAAVQAHFDPKRNAMVIDPIMARFAHNSMVLSAVVEAPKPGETLWPVSLRQGVFNLSSGAQGEVPLVLDQVFFNGAFDPDEERLVIRQGEVSGMVTGGAFSGSINFGANPMLDVGIAASKMPVSAAKRMWPPFIAPGTRGWAMDRIEQGSIERILIALNVPLDSIGRQHVELPDAAVRLEMNASGGTFRPTAESPLIRDAEVNVLVTGRTARVRVSRAHVDVPERGRIVLTDGRVDVADHVPPNPPGTIRFRMQGPAEAVAEVAAADLMQNVTDAKIDPATVKGSVSADVRVDLVFRRELRGEEINYQVAGELKDFAADRVVRDQPVDGVNAKVSLTSSFVDVKGEGNIAGAPSNFSYRKSKAKGEADFRLATTMGDVARASSGIDFGPSLTGPVAVRAEGRIGVRDTRIDVETDLTAAAVNDLVPGWHKPAGRPATGKFRLIKHKEGIRLEEVAISGSGAKIEGTIELDNDGDFVSAELPVFHLSDGDRANLRAARASDGTLRVSVRGDLLDARGAMRGLTEGPVAPATGRAQNPRDLDLELRLGAATGNNGEVARQIDLRLVRRNGEVRAFSLLGKIGRDASMVGELRRRQNGKPALYLTTGDAGALFRFGDFYTRIHGGEAWILIDPPGADGAPQNGLLNLREFVVRGEPSLARMQAAAPPDPNDLRPRAQQPRDQGVAFLRMQVDFSRTPGRFDIRDSLIYGPTMGANVEGMLDFAKNRVQLRGTYIPGFGLNNLFAQIPVVGLFLGGPREGLFAITFEVAGPASGPTLRILPMSAVTPGIIRKLYDFRSASGLPPAVPFDR
jgi:hypothetical protein